jgi:alpha-amylase
MDYVINHSAAEHPMFEQARQGPSTPSTTGSSGPTAGPAGWDIWGQDPWYHTAAGEPWTGRAI